MGKTLFITGTGTDVGKTALSLAALLWARDRGLRARYLKPVQCGESVFGDPPVAGGDAEWIGRMAGDPQSTQVTYQLRMAASPHLAAEREGVVIDRDRLRRDLERAAAGCDLLIAEGAGGSAVPLDRKGSSLGALAAELSLPCLIACAPGLGTLHHTLTTVAWLRAAGAAIAGFAVCHREPSRPELTADNIRTLADLTGLPCFGELPYLEKLARGAPLARAEAAAWCAPLAPSLEAWWNPEPK
jgi:dethiobiotin synthetase